MKPELFAHNFYPTGNNVQTFIEQFFQITAVRKFYNASIAPPATIAEDNEMIFFEEISAYSTADINQISGDLHNITGGVYNFRARAVTQFGSVFQYESLINLSNLLVFKIDNILNVGFASSYGYIFTYKSL
jgi:hypothetical protein